MSAALGYSRHRWHCLGLGVRVCDAFRTARVQTVASGAKVRDLQEPAHVLRAVGCRALITAARFKTSDYIAMIRELVPELGSGSRGLKSSRLPELLRFPPHLTTSSVV